MIDRIRNGRRVFWRNPATLCDGSGVVIGYGRYGRPWNLYRVRADVGDTELYIHPDNIYAVETA